jgi:metal-dependent amidase/aminoacylase/carboxypeptidase family protein
VELEPGIIDIRRHIHENSKINWEEYGPADFIKSKLKELKVLCKHVGKTGVI